MKYGKILKSDTANGPGMRLTLFVSGCRNQCPGCFNPQTWDFNYGEEFTGDTRDSILEILGKSYYQGMTILGGEPMEPENQPEILELIRKFRNTFGRTRDIWIYTGFTCEELRSKECRACTESINEILSSIDVLVDGRFRMEEKDITLKFRGSRNQRLINMPETLKSGTVVLYSA